MKDKKLNSGVNALKEILFQKVNTFKLLVVVLLLLNIIIFINLIFKNKTKKATSNTISVAFSTPIPTILPIPTDYTPIKSDNSEMEYVPVDIGTNPQKINIETKKIITNEDVIADFSKFINLPKEYKNSQTSLKNKDRLYSQNKLSVIVQSIKYDEAAEPSGYDGSQPIISVEEYTCQTKTKICNKSNIFPNSITDLPLFWTNWDSQKNILYGHIYGAPIGLVTPVYIYDVNKKAYQIIGKDDLAYDFATVPINFISPSLSQFILIRKSDNKLLLYDLKNISEPKKEININFYVSSIYWFKDEEKIAIETGSEIYILDLRTEILSRKYIGKKDNWIYGFTLSPNERYLIFVDWVNRKSSDIKGSSWILRAIDLKNNDSIFDVFVSVKDILNIRTSFFR